MKIEENEEIKRNQMIVESKSFQSIVNKPATTHSEAHCKSQLLNPLYRRLYFLTYNSVFFSLKIIKILIIKLVSQSCEIMCWFYIYN
jgi:hypothetical protein